MYVIDEIPWVKIRKSIRSYLFFPFLQCQFIDTLRQLEIHRFKSSPPTYFVLCSHQAVLGSGHVDILLRRWPALRD